MPPKRDKKQYQRLDPIQHCLRRADMYVGSLRPKRTLEYVASTTEDGFSIVQEEISFAPALLRIFIEALSNAVDNVERSREAGIPCTRIKVTLDRETGETSIWNDGYVVPIDIHPEENCYIHSMIFGQLLTGSNYDDEEERIIAGRNGIGIKATSIFSNEFHVEGVDPSVGKIFKQKWTQNMQKTSEPSVKASSRKTGYTKVTWIPDFKRFGITRYSLDIIKLYTRHVIDAAMLSGVSVSLNGSDVPVKNLNHYAALYPSLTEERLLIQSESAKVLVMPNNGQTPGGECISFVNGMYTKLGGQHVDAWSEALFRPIVTKFNSRGGAKGAKSNQKININDVKQFFRLFVLVTVVRPEFNGQNKEQLESPSIEAQVKRTQINTICKWSVMERIEDIIRAKEMVILKKIEKKKKVIVPGLDAANNAGGKHATQCSLFVCEGLSAKTYIVAGIGGELYGKSGRDWFGILPVTGKLLNVRNATPTVIAANKVIVGLIQALGLTQGLDYRQDKNFKTLNYGKLILTCDADCFANDTPLLVKHKNNTIDITSIENLSQKWVDNIAILEDIEVWSRGGWTKVLGLTRKETTKKMLEISAYCGIIHCTEDHKMLLEDGSETTARNLKPGDRLLRTRRIQKTTIEPPYTHKECKQLAKTMQVYKSGELSNKPALLQAVRDENNFCDSMEDVEEQSDLDLEEAWLHGFFFAEGTCDIYKFSKDRTKATQRNTERSRERWRKWISKYEERIVAMELLAERGELTLKDKRLLSVTRKRLISARKMTTRVSNVKSSNLVRTNYSWSISNCDKQLLEKSKAILERIYPDHSYTLCQVTVADNHSPQYRLILNGGKKVQNHIEMWRSLFYDPIIRKNKKIPSSILNASREIQQSFFDGYYDGDGFRYSKREQNSLGFDILGQIGAQGLCFITERLGYTSSIHKKPYKNDVYTVSITNRYKRHYPGLIKSVSEIDYDHPYVYDIETENHMLNAGIGGLVVHNCDGLHIEALVMNVIHALFPTLLERSEPFIISMKTPIARVFRPRKKDLLFYDEHRFNQYLTETKGKVSAKYYKGLGTTRAEDVPDTFGKKLVEYSNDPSLSDTMNKVFHKSHTDPRKEWIGAYNPSKVDWSLDDQDMISSMHISEFLDKELIKFSHTDCGRSIASMVDGLKESQRKILYAVCKRKLHYSGKSLKVAQLSGYTAEHSNYHHGEQNLQDTIIGMASDFVGSNNIPLLYPDGGFGSRLAGGADAASARYIYTKKAALTDLIFRSEDEPLLEQVNDDGDLVQPVFYMPIIPMILVNGSLGIGTGWSSTIPNFNPIEIIEATRTWIEHGGETTLEDPDSGETIELFSELQPWYRGFTGNIERESATRYITHGVLNRTKTNSVEITELPIGLWTNKFKEMCETLVVDKKLKSLKNYSTTDKVNIQLTETKDGLKCNATNLKLSNSLSLNNMVLFTEQEQIKKYKSALEILCDFCVLRLEFYVKRKTYQLKMLEAELRHLENKLRFTQGVIDRSINIMDEDEDSLILLLDQQKFDRDPSDQTFNYLLRLPIRSLTTNKMKELKNVIDKLIAQIKKLRKTTPQNIWLAELDQLESAYTKWIN
jgi:DNA gyrase/topoisomerase IV subunit B